MNVIATTTSMLERLPVPDALMRAGISSLVGRTHRLWRATARSRYCLRRLHGRAPDRRAHRRRE